MTVTPIFRSRRAAPIHAAARWAVVSVPAHLSARGLAVPVWAALMLPAIALLPVASPWASLILAPAFALAAGLRLAALANLFLPKPEEPPPLADGDLPAVTVLVPLFREAAVMPDLVAAVARLDYPAHLLVVMLLLEEVDTATIAAARAHAPAGWRTIVVPPGSPQAKPRACNVGLALARGDVVVVFDGEDRPDADQPRKAAAALAADPRLAVVQARLGCDHAGRGSPIVTRLWALEYAALFGAVLPLLSRLGLPFLLGGTSNWFRAEAPLRAGVWVRQRARWFKGFAVTAIVHARTPRQTARQIGPAGCIALLAQLPVSLLCTAAHPLGAGLALGGDLSGPLGWLLLLGYAAAVALHAAAAPRAGLPAWLALLLPFYWLLHWAALILALSDLVRDPAHWRKTEHGCTARPVVSPEQVEAGAALSAQ